MFSHMTRISLMVSAAWVLTACSAPAEIQISDAAVRALIPGRDTTAGYFVVRNNTDTAITLLGASSSAARAIEMHRTVITEDRVRMQRVADVNIPPGERVEFARGGLHLMIFGVKDFPEPFPITLQFNNNRQVAVSFSKLPN